MNDRIKLTLWLGFGGILVTIIVAFWSHAGFWETIFFWTAIPLALLSSVMIASIVLRLQVHDTENEFGNGWTTRIDVGLTPLVTNQLKVWLTGIILSLALGLVMASITGHDDSDKHVPSVATIDENATRPQVDSDGTSQQTLQHERTTSTPVKVEEPPPPLPDRADTNQIDDKPIARPQTPRTPYELIEMARTKTRRDAMEHKGYRIHVEGSVLDISEVQKGVLRALPYDFIEIEVAVGPPPHKKFSPTVRLAVEADHWKQQVDTIERGDWLVANGVVEYVGKGWMHVFNGKIISVSGGDRSRKSADRAIHSIHLATLRVLPGGSPFAGSAAQSL